MKNQEGADLLCVGNAIIDVFSQVDEEVDSYLPLGPAVRHVSFDQITEILVTLPEPVFSSGGGSANVAKIASLLGTPSAFIGVVGSQPSGKKDHFAELFEKELQDAGVILELIQGKAPTGACIILQKSDGSTIITASPSASLELTPEDIPEEAIRRAQVLVIDGYMLGRETLVRRLLEMADEHGTSVALDVGSAEIARTWALTIEAYCRAYPLILFMNEAEAEALYTALLESQKRDVRRPVGIRQIDAFSREMFEFFREFTAQDIFPIIVVKRGPKGAAVFAGGRIYRSETLAVIPLETTGAGDAFCAAFLSAWIREKSLGQCADMGNRVAREVLDTPGTRIDKKKFTALAKSLDW
ncbi:carbohydrate kinase family protein [Breznakiella homolactica]|uniref:Adenosine kinase n=1 Tax=Breznakiella homolactica TaxID=2798577 RepID=A0A7T7XM76_9SPIR|nr:adenosine kinase [Breznakiella homolactica]QQO08941.1 adenosine kinase [Breznakiella homolactica]